MACSIILKSNLRFSSGTLSLERLKPRKGILRNLPLEPVEKPFRLKPVNAKRFPTFRVSAIMKLFYYAAINAVLFWLAQRSNRMEAVRSFSVKHPIALWAFQFDFVFCHKKTSSILNIITSTLIHLCSPHSIAYQLTLKMRLVNVSSISKKRIGCGRHLHC